MNSEVYGFKLGTFECVAVSDGTHTYAPPIFPPAGIFLFSNAPALISAPTPITPPKEVPVIATSTQRYCFLGFPSMFSPPSIVFSRPSSF